MSINAKNARQAAFLNAFNADTSAARAVVLAFEDVMVGYYTEDSRNPINIQFVLNVMASRPKLQRVAKSLVGTLGDFKITVDVEATPADKSQIFYKVANVKDENLSKAERQEVIERYIAEVGKFQERELSSLIEWSKAQSNPSSSKTVEYSADKSADTVTKAFDKAIQMALENDGNLAELFEALQSRLTAAKATTNINKIRDVVEDKQRKAAQRQEDAERKAARKARDEEAETESESESA